MKRTLIPLIVISALGLLVTGYLTFAHYTNTSPICPIGGDAGCALAAVSKYAIIGPLPVAVYGMIAWTLILGLSLWMYKHHNTRHIWKTIIILSLGVAAAGYFNAIMYKLGAFCIWCETSHTLMLIGFILATRFAFGTKWIMKTTLAILLLFAIPFALAVRTSPSETALPLAECLRANNVTMYGAYWCPHCKEQKQLFGDAFGEINYVECANPENPNVQNPICDEANITGYPTWINGDKRISGTQRLDTLAAFGGCTTSKITVPS